jgi:hypothetical protein
MDIAKYVDYFHDGEVNGISHIGKNISFSMESAEIENLDEIADRDVLSDYNSFKGILNIYNIKKFIMHHKDFEGVCQMQYDKGRILDLEINGNNVYLLVEWRNFPPKVRTRDVSEIIIEAEKIEWIPEK